MIPRERERERGEDCRQSVNEAKLFGFIPTKINPALFAIELLAQKALFS